MSREQGVLDAIRVIQANMVDDQALVSDIIKRTDGGELAAGLLGFASGLVETLANLMGVTNEALIDQMLLLQQAKVMEAERDA